MVQCQSSVHNRCELAMSVKKPILLSLSGAIGFGDMVLLILLDTFSD